MARTKLKPPPPLADVIQATPGKPTKYDAKVARKVLNRIADGELLINIAKDDDMPSPRTFRYWLESRAELSEPHARARLSWADTLAERVIALATDPRGNFIDEKGNRLLLSHEEVAQRRLEIDSIKWLVGKWAPRTYGERPEPPTEQEEPIVKITRVIVDNPRARAPVPEPGEPLQLTYVPKLPTPDGPLPEAVQTRLRGILERCVPSNRHANPYALWDEVAGVIERALTEHYGSKTP